MCQNKLQVIRRNRNIEEGGLGTGYDKLSTEPEVCWERNKTHRRCKKFEGVPINTGESKILKNLLPEIPAKEQVSDS